MQNNPSQYKDICKDCENEILIQSKDKNQVNACIKMMNEGKDLEEIMKTLEITMSCPSPLIREQTLFTEIMRRERQIS